MNEIEKKIRDKGIFKVAKELNVSPQRVTNWIRRKSYPLQFIRPLSKILNMKIEEFLEELEIKEIK